MPPVTSALERLIPGPRATAAIVVIGAIATGFAWHAADHDGTVARHLAVQTRTVVHETVRRRQRWRALARRVRRVPGGPAQPITQTVPRALAALERAAVVCGTPLSSLTTTAAGTALYALNPAHAAHTVAWAPGVQSLGFVAEGQWHTLSGLTCLVRSLRATPVALSAFRVNATTYILGLEVLGG